MRYTILLKSGETRELTTDDEVTGASLCPVCGELLAFQFAPSGPANETMHFKVGDRAMATINNIPDMVDPQFECFSCRWAGHLSEAVAGTLTTEV